MEVLQTRIETQEELENPFTQQVNQPEEVERKPSFEQLLEEYDYERPHRGEILEGEVVYTSDKNVLLDVGVKRDAFVPQKDLEALDLRYREKIKKGDFLPVYVTQVFSPKGNLIVSIKKGFEHADWKRAEEYLESGKIFDAQVIGKNRGGLLVKFGTLQGFIPRSHLVTGKDYFYASDEDEQSLPSLELKVIEVDRGKRRLVLSEKKAFEELLDEHLKDYYEGQVLMARVKRVLNFGAFLDLNGLEGFLHISDIDWGWVEDPSDFLTEGEEVEVYVKEVDHERKQVRLSRKDLFPVP